jgi:hypothetical protein
MYRFPPAVAAQMYRFTPFLHLFDHFTPLFAVFSRF